MIMLFLGCFWIKLALVVLFVYDGLRPSILWLTEDDILSREYTSNQSFDHLRHISSIIHKLINYSLWVSASLIRSSIIALYKIPADEMPADARWCLLLPYLSIATYDQNPPYLRKLNIRYFQPQINDRRRRVGKNLTACTQKEILCSFIMWTISLTVLELRTNLWTPLFGKNTHFKPLYDSPSAQ